MNVFIRNINSDIFLFKIYRTNKSLLSRNSILLANVYLLHRLFLYITINESCLKE